jgi:hypothetical protein
MKKVFTLLSLSLLLAAGAAHAQTAQQGKMTTCNKDATAKALKGDERKAFMKECLGAKPAPVADKRKAQQEKMKTCNKDAGDKALKGAERKAFMKECLSNKG